MTTPSIFRASRLALGLLLLLVLLPLLAVAVYAFSEQWVGLLPQGATLAWLREALLDARIHAAVWHTAWLSLLSALLALLLGGGTSLWARLSAPRLLALLDALALLPYAIPPVVMAIGALELFVGRWGAVLNVQVVYVAVITPTLLALVHKTLGAALQQLDARQLLEAGRTLGASDGLLLWRVLLPLLRPALATSLVLGWIAGATEFAIANLLLGGSVELLQPLINSMRGINGHQAAALIVLTLALMLAVSLLVQTWISWNRPRNS
ncbi:MAG: ABC transporter permease subunit [Burkholderiaceae bacterium]|nr:ABC transporter permease subunit [Roseateles sp.]MBV8471281.1 ABC transporter permease subunit [Burkholderiaceae bacterium]